MASKQAENEAVEDERPCPVGMFEVEKRASAVCNPPCMVELARRVHQQVAEPPPGR
jgi:hypothetical protein